MTYDDRDRVIAWLADGHGDKLTTLDRAVLATIAQYANSGTGHSWRGVEYLATVWGVDVRSVKRAIARLHRLGQIETAERGIGHRRARYRLAGELMSTEVGGHPGHPKGTEVGGPKQQLRVTETTKKGDLGVTRISKSSRSYSGEMTIDDGATAPGSLGVARRCADRGRSQTDPRNSSTTPMTKQRSGSKPSSLVGNLRNTDAYLLRCLDNQAADTAKAKASPGRGSAKKTTPKPEVCGKDQRQNGRQATKEKTDRYPVQGRRLRHQPCHSRS